MNLRESKNPILAGNRHKYVIELEVLFKLSSLPFKGKRGELAGIQQNFISNTSKSCQKELKTLWSSFTSIIVIFQTKMGTSIN